MYSINSEYGLVIKSVEINDDGEYICRAQNSEGFGQDSRVIYIETKGIFWNFLIKYFDEKTLILESIKFILKPKSIYHVNEGERLILPCVAFGNPQPKIKWFKVCFKFSFLKKKECNYL